MTTFDEAFVRVLGCEGGYTSSPADRGNWTGGDVGRGVCKGTKYGISAAAYPGDDIEHLDIDRAKTLYLRDYWGPAGCDGAPEAVRYGLFDMSVNSGVKAAVKALQKAVGEVEDGILGPHTLQAMQSMPALRLVARFNGARLLHVSDATAWPAYGRGWCRRIATNLLES